MKGLLYLLFFLFAFSGCDPAAAEIGCSDDADCRFGRQCVQNTCIDEAAADSPPPAPPLEGLSTIVQLRMGQSNETTHCENHYVSGIGGEWDGAILSPTAERNSMNYAHQKMEADGIAFNWAKHAIGSTQLVEFCPGGSQHAALLAQEALLFSEYGKIDLVTMFIGESNASVGTTQAQYVALIYQFIAGLVNSPTCFLAIGPLDMTDVLDEQEEAIRDAYREVAATLDNFYYVSIDSISDDDLIDNHHIYYEATADEASDLIRVAIMGLITGRTRANVEMEFFSPASDSD